jgi:hypothetical protein
MIIVPPASSQASPAAQELGQKITTVIREYQQSHPGLPHADVHQALRLAQMNSGVGAGSRSKLAVLVGLLLLGAFLAFSLHSRQDGGSTSSPFMPFLVLVLIVVLLGIVVVAKR